MSEEQSETFKTLAGYFLPAGTLDYFDLVRVLKDKEGLVLFLEERNELPEEFTGQQYHSKGFLPEVRVQDFPIRDKRQN